MMRQAGIAVWMLTGDKQETAINIGFSCKLIDEHQELFSLDTDSLEVRSRLRILDIVSLTFLFQSTQTILKEYREQCNNLLNGHSAESSGGRKKDIALIITGRTMKFVFKPSTRIGIPDSQFLCLTVHVDHLRNPLQEKISCFYH